ncbi:MAG: response regulator transcription factor [Oscillospiraceae bacterium]|nr:response regulator transcription factor [Oscillospiraceae bacterium]
MKQTILLIEDETDVMLANQELLESAGYRTVAAETLKEGWERLREQPPDLIILDVMLPDGLGLDFCKRVRELYTVPVLYLTCRDEPRQIVEGLQSGGDDYMTKPYRMDELLARCQAILRRVEMERRRQPEIIRLPPLTLDPLKQKAVLDGRDLLLTPKEFALLLFFVKQPEKGFTAGELYKAIWGDLQTEDVRTVKAHIYNLRKKLKTSKDNGFALVMSGRTHYVWQSRFSVKS